MKSLIKTFATSVLGLFATAAIADDSVGKMAYVQSDGSATQFLDTGYRPLASSPFVVGMKGKWPTIDKNARLVGVYSSTNDRYEFGIHARKWEFGGIDSTTSADTNEHEFLADFAGGKFWIDGLIVISDCPPPTVDAPGNFYLFRRNPGNTGYGFLFRWCKFTQDGIVVRKYVPWKDSNGTVCLYDHVTKRCYYKGNGNNFSVAALGENDFYYTVDNDMATTDNPTTLQVRRGTVDDVEILTMHDVVEKLGADTTVTFPETATNFPALRLTEGSLSFVDHKATAMKVDGALTLAGGTTLKIDVVGAACDSFTPTAVNFSGATARNPVVIEVSVTSPDWSNGMTVISQGMPDDIPTTAIMAVQGTVELVTKIEDGKLIVAQPPSPVAHWTGAANDGNVANPDNWAYTNFMGQAESRVPDAYTIVYFNGSSLPDVTGSFAALLVQANVTLENDRNWSGITSPFAGRIDLNGHNLAVSQLNGDCEITDSTRILPNAYEQLEYIASSGTQFINTGYVPLATPAFEVELQGGWTSYSTKKANLFGVLDCRYYFGVNNGGRIIFAGGKTYEFAPDTDEHLFAANFETGEFKRDGTVVCTADPVTNDCSGSFYLFSRNDGGSNCHSWFRLRWCKLMQGGKVVRDYVPARERSGSKRVGLYDLANGIFYFRQGSNDFIAGNVVEQEVTPGELHVSNTVAVVNSAVALSGSLRLVKEGTGTFTVAKSDQTYFGGTLVAGGMLTVPEGGDSSSKFLGAEGTDVKVGSGAILELNGYPSFNVHPLVLAGGTVQNSSTTATIGDVTLSADSTIRSGEDACIAMAGLIGLDGSTTRTVTLTGEGMFKPTGSAKDMSAVDFVLDGAINLDVDITVRNWTVTYTGAAADGGGKIHICGVYKPMTDYIHNFEMQDGSMLDFGGMTAPLSDSTLCYADGATINVIPGARIGKLVDWTGCPPADTVTFKLGTESSDGVLKETPDGLYFFHKNITILFR